MITKHIILIAAFAITTILISCGRVGYDKEFSGRLSMNLEKLREDPSVIDGNLIYNPDMLIEIYEKDEGLLHARWDSWENIDQILYSIRNDYRDGLNPEDYHLLAIEDLVDSLLTSEEVDIADSARMELLLTDAFLLLSAHLAEEPVPVEILYLTAWSGDNGTVHFREDIYKLDRQVLAALKKDPPRPGL